VESPNVTNFAYNCKKTSTTSEGGPTICISSTNEKKTQVGHVASIGLKTQKCVMANNISPKGSP
jgi:hypothetical protein